MRWSGWVALCLLVGCSPAARNEGELSGSLRGVTLEAVALDVQRSRGTYLDGDCASAPGGTLVLVYGGEQPLLRFALRYSRLRLHYPENRDRALVPSGAPSIQPSVSEGGDPQYRWEAVHREVAPAVTDGRLTFDRALTTHQRGTLVLRYEDQSELQGTFDLRSNAIDEVECSDDPNPFQYLPIPGPH